MIKGVDTVRGNVLGLWKFSDQITATWYELWKYSNKMAYLRQISTHIKASVEIIH